MASCLPAVNAGSTAEQMSKPEMNAVHRPTLPSVMSLLHSSNAAAHASTHASFNGWTKSAPLMAPTSQPLVNQPAKVETSIGFEATRRSSAVSMHPQGIPPTTNDTNPVSTAIAMPLSGPSAKDGVIKHEEGMEDDSRAAKRTRFEVPRVGEHRSRHSPTPSASSTGSWEAADLESLPRRVQSLNDMKSLNQPRPLSADHRNGSLDLLIEAAERASKQLPSSHAGNMKHSRSTGCLNGQGVICSRVSAEPSQRTVESKTAGRLSRPIRPKVIESKGAIQCIGINRKKRTQCRNAALMEYVGPRPRYCAEHIALDPQARYHKCDFAMPDNKRCKEIVYHCFDRCYKHMQQWLDKEFTTANDVPRLQELLQQATQILRQLESEAAVAKRDDPELYQRKSKLIPKYQAMETILSQQIDSL